MSTELNKWELRRELLSIPSKSKKLKLATAKEKVRGILDKYDDLISYSAESKDQYREECYALRNIIEAMKTGIVKYEGGFFRVSEVERVKITDSNVTVYYKSGTEQNFVIAFTWLKGLW